MTDGGGTLYTVRGGLLFPSSLFFSLSGGKKSPSICGKERGGGRGWEKDEAVALSKCVVREGVSAAAHSCDGKDEISPKFERKETKLHREWKLDRSEGRNILSIFVPGKRVSPSSSISFFPRLPFLFEEVRCVRLCLPPPVVPPPPPTPPGFLPHLALPLFGTGKQKKEREKGPFIGCHATASHLTYYTCRQSLSSGGVGAGALCWSVFLSRSCE